MALQAGSSGPAEPGSDPPRWFNSSYGARSIYGLRTLPVKHFLIMIWMMLCLDGGAETLSRLAPVNRQDRAGRVAGRIAGEVQHAADDLLGLPDALQAEPPHPLVERLPVPSGRDVRLEG